MSGITDRAIVRDGRLVTTEKITLPEGTEVVFVPTSEPQTDAAADEAQRRIFASLAGSYISGQFDLAERHNEHQP